MKNFVLFIAFITPLPISAANLSFKISELENNKGQVRILLFSVKNKEHFPKQVTFATCLSTAKMNKNTAIAHCNNIAPGRYAAYIFHDENGDDITNHNWLGFPKEKFGYYKNFKVKILPPNFDDVAFDVTLKEHTFLVPLQNYND